METAGEAASLWQDFVQGCKYGVVFLAIWVAVALAALLWTRIRRGSDAEFSVNDSYLVAGAIPVLSLIAVGYSSTPMLWGCPTAEERLFAVVPAGKMISQLQVGYQVFCLVGAVFCGYPQSKPENIAHHFLAGLASTLSLLPFAQYYCIFFGSLVELSTAPLTVLDLFKRNRQYIEKYPSAYSATKAVFALSFLSLRVLIWPYFAVRMGLDVYIMRGEIPFYSQIITYTALLGLTGLQLLWGRLVLRNVILTLRGQDRYLKKKET
uniref:TLC domain-containing protein n=1 Tax=Pinguiococcus pyrenoidosus TaxID=172671 RepID=A0A7R9YDN5_9STRA|mmetsp:Transcript_4958/g.19840  ORF Transcript_4958/g.19840 Transcript_4958/m.19840 type:complete len:265 (+) Transcript_4958:194-988(+)